MVFCFENCSDILRETIDLVMEKKFCKFAIEGQVFANFWDHIDNWFEQCKFRTVFVIE